MRKGKLHKRLKIGLVVIAFVVASSLGVWFYIVRQATAETLGVHDKRYRLEVANTPTQRAQGLSGREALEQDSGMLFVFGNVGRHCFWMKDMRFGLDIVWMDSNKEVVHIEAGVLPDTFPRSFCPSQASLYVLEINSGKAEEWGIAEGDVLSF